jgi:hypothetical protein
MVYIYCTSLRIYEIPAAPKKSDQPKGPAKDFQHIRGWIPADNEL